MKIVVKIGGSVSIGEKGPNFFYFFRLLPILSEIKKKNQLIVVIGGGKLTRTYGKSIEKFKLKGEDKEKIFIELIKANVVFLSALLKMQPIFSLSKINKKTSGVIGGIEPGRSTDANAAIAARKIKADLFIKMTNVNGVYDKDPNKFKGAKKIDQLPFSELAKLAPKGRPNKYGVLDKLAVETLSAGRIRTMIINGKDPENLLKALANKQIGTVIEH